MGALTSNRNKRDAEFQSLSPSGFGYDHLHISKKLKSSSSSSPSAGSVKSWVSRLSLYPQQVTPIAREIHAPCRVVNGFTSNSRRLSSRSGSISRKSDFSGDGMWNFFVAKYKSAKEAAIDCCKHVMFEKVDEIVEVTDDDDEGDKEETVNDDNAASGDSGVEEAAMVESEREAMNESGELQQIIARYRELNGTDEENLGFQPSSSSGLLSELMDGKTLESLSLNQRADDSNADVDLPYHKKMLLYSAEKHDARLRRLSFDIKLQEEKRALYKQLRPTKKEEDKLVEPFRPLTKEDEEMVDNALSNSSRRKILVTHDNSNIIITGEVLQCLKPRTWLNDEVINVYLELLKEREKREPQKFLKCHFFNTFFYKKLISGKTGYDYKSVRRWTTQRKLGYSLLECDKIFVPVHKEIHWCLAVINKKESKFQYLDSLGGVDKQVMRVLTKYIVDEVKDKNEKDLDVTSWKQEYVTDLPNQENGFDCGVFMIKYADFYSRDIGLCFKQDHMPYFRLRTAKEILRLRAD